MPVELGQSAVPGEAFPEVKNPCQHEDDRDDADGDGGAQRGQEPPEVLHGHPGGGSTMQLMSQQQEQQLQEAAAERGPLSRDPELRAPLGGGCFVSCLVITQETLTTVSQN